MADMDDDELLDALGVEVAPIKAGKYTALEERLIAGFEDILRFHAEHGRVPEHGEDRDIFERLYAVRLERLRSLPEARTLLAPLDTPRLLETPPSAAANADQLDDETLLAELGVDLQSKDDDITVLRHVKSHEQRQIAEDVASRQRCEDFDRFKPLFELAERDLKEGTRRTLRFGRDASVAQGNFFILGGQMVYVAEVGEAIRAPNGDTDARLRVIYSNGTESDLLMRSLQRALYKDDTGRRLSDPDAGPLFGDALGSDDIVSGTIYVLRSNSDHPFVVAHRELIHKIGVTSGAVEDRVSNARRETTYLLADVEIVASYAVANLSSSKLEALFHRLFSATQLDLTIVDRFGMPVKPREWFLVPLHVIDEAVQRIRDGSIERWTYDLASAQLVEATPPH